MVYYNQKYITNDTNYKMRSMLDKGNASAAPNINSFKLSSLRFKGAIEILSPPSPKSERSAKSEHSKEIFNNIEVFESDCCESLAKKRISRYITSV